MSFIASIMAIVRLLGELVSGAKVLAAFVQENKNEKWFKDSVQTFTNLRNTLNAPSMSDADRAKRLKDAGRNIRALMDGL